MNPVRPYWYYVYVLKSQKYNRLYTGDLKQRLEQHNKGLVRSTKYMCPVQLIYFEACLNKDDVYRREKYLKSGMGKRYIRNRLKGGLTG